MNQKKKYNCNYNIFTKPYYVNGVQRTQGGRWNTSSTNTKLFPVISKEITKESPTPIIKKQSGNIFKSTTHHMSKRELHSYLTRNRAYLHR